MKSWLNLPNSLTLSRIAVVPLLFFLWGNGHLLSAALCAGVAALTDFFDGHLARATNQVTLVGAILDPVADKVMVMSLFALLNYDGIIPTWLLAVTVLRNVSQLTSIPVLMWWKKINFKVRPAFIPRFASGLSFVLIVVCFAVAAPGSKTLSGPLLRWILPAAFVIQALLEIQIFITYWPRFYQILNRKHDTFE